MHGENLNFKHTHFSRSWPLSRVFRRVRKISCSSFHLSAWQNWSSYWADFPEILYKKIFRKWFEKIRLNKNWV